MIKINLANSVLKKSTKTASSFAESKMVKEGLIKVAIMIAPTLGLLYYEKIDLDEKSSNLAKLTAERDRINADLTSKGSVDEIVKQVEVQQKEMDEKIHVMEQIFGSRGKKIQALALLQKNILGSMWLNKILVSEISNTDNDKSKKTSISIFGVGTNKDDLYAFQNSLTQEKGIFEPAQGIQIKAEEGNKSNLVNFNFDITLQE